MKLGSFSFVRAHLFDCFFFEVPLDFCVFAVEFAGQKDSLSITILHRHGQWDNLSSSALTVCAVSGQRVRTGDSKLLE
jgi:hypothetical protein